MTRENAKDEIRRRLDCSRYLKKSKSGLFVCPFCGSGEGANHTGALRLYSTNTFTCFSCRKSGDVIDLIMNDTHADFNTAFEMAAGELGIDITYNDRVYEPRSDEKTKEDNNAVPDDISLFRPDPEEVKPKYSDQSYYYKRCSELLVEHEEAISYLSARGISLDTALAYSLGFDPFADPAGTGHFEPRIIIPTNDYHYVARRLQHIDSYDKMNNRAPVDIFNSAAIYEDNKQIFVVEGWADALSIIEAGYPAIALNSAGNWKRLIERLKEHKTSAKFYICPDNDTDEKAAANVQKHLSEFTAALSNLKIEYKVVDICSGYIDENGDEVKYKDANDALRYNRDAFVKKVTSTVNNDTTKPYNTSHYIDLKMLEDIERMKITGGKKTGFSNLDSVSGGLYSGLYIIAAASSLGKTTFSLQIADNLASAGHDVLFFSLEQSRLELLSKSISRISKELEQIAIINKNKLPEDLTTPLSSLDVRMGLYSSVVALAADEYKRRIGDRMSIIEANFDCNVSSIKQYVKDYIRVNKVRPVIFIDYLQILQADEGMSNANTKAIVDFTLTELKRMTRELDITIIAISSVNRSSYLYPIDFESLKESGNIEFTADVVWGLQFKCLNDEIFDSEKKLKEKRARIKAARRETPREIQLCCLKNRFGIGYYEAFFKYFTPYDTFVPEESKFSPCDNAPFNSSDKKEVRRL